MLSAVCNFTLLSLLVHRRTSSLFLASSSLPLFSAPATGFFLSPSAMSESRPGDYYPKECPPNTTSVHVTALDGLVNVNSLFTIAVFVGLSLTTKGQQSLEDRTACDAGDGEARRLLVYEVVSFSFFLFSSLIAQGLKLAINLLNSKDTHDAVRAHINLTILRVGMLASAAGSVMGCVFLVLSMVCVIEIRLGLLSCGSAAAVRAVAALVTLVATALLTYISTALYAFTH